MELRGDEKCDATGDDSSTKAGNINSNNIKKYVTKNIRIGAYIGNTSAHVRRVVQQVFAGC